MPQLIRQYQFNWSFKWFIRWQCMRRSIWDPKKLPLQRTTQTENGMFYMLYRGWWDGSDERLPHFPGCEALYTDGTKGACSCGVRLLAEGHLFRFVRVRAVSLGRRLPSTYRWYRDRDPFLDQSLSGRLRVRTLLQSMQALWRARLAIFPAPAGGLIQVRSWPPRSKTEESSDSQQPSGLQQK